MKPNHQVVIEAIMARLEDLNRELDGLLDLLDRVEALEAKK